MMLKINDAAPDFAAKHKVSTPVNWKRVRT